MEVKSRPTVRIVPHRNVILLGPASHPRQNSLDTASRPTERYWIAQIINTLREISHHSN